MANKLFLLSPILKKLFSSKVRIKVLSHYFSHPGEDFYINELMRILDEFPGSLPRELVNLEEAGILVSNFLGRKKYYALNQKSPIIGDLRNIFMKTTGEASLRAENKIEPDEKATVVLSTEQQVILQAIGDDGAIAEDIFSATGLPAAVVQRNLVMLELKNCVSKTGRGLYCRKDGITYIIA